MKAPLEGKRILITRSSEQAAEFRLLLEKAGARVLEVPTIRIQPRPLHHLDAAIQQLDRYDWIIFTSVNGAEIFLERLCRVASPRSGGPRVCAIGPATADRILQEGWSVDLVPSRYQAEGVIKEFLARHGGKITGLRILIPRASEAREILPRELERLGARVEVLPVYDTVPAEENRQALVTALREESPDLIVFTSSSTARNFVLLSGEKESLQRFRYAAIGPITARTASELGLPVVVQPEQATIPDLARAIEAYFGAVSFSNPQR